MCGICSSANAPPLPTLVQLLSLLLCKLKHVARTRRHICNHVYLAPVYPLTWASLPGPFKGAIRPSQVRSPGETVAGGNDGKEAITEPNYVNLLSFRVVPSGRTSNVVLSGHGEAAVGEASGVWQREGGGAGEGRVWRRWWEGGRWRGLGLSFSLSLPQSLQPREASRVSRKESAVRYVCVSVSCGGECACVCIAFVLRSLQGCCFVVVLR